MKLNSGVLAQAIPFTRSAVLARTVNASNTKIGRSGVVRGIPGFPAGIKLGNLPSSLSDYINTPGTPGSSTFYMYGLGQDDDFFATDDANASATTQPPTTSNSPSFASALQSIVGSIASVVPSVVQATTAMTAQKQLAAGQISPTQYAQITGAAPPAGTLPIFSRTGAGLGVGTIALIGAGILAFFMLKKR